MGVVNSSMTSGLRGNVDGRAKRRAAYLAYKLTTVGNLQNIPVENNNQPMGTHVRFPVLAALDPPPGSFVSSTTKYPTSSWLPESVGALLAEGTKLEYIVYTHAHWVSVARSPLRVHSRMHGPRPQQWCPYCV